MIKFDLRPAMNDGVELACDVYLSKNLRRTPTILYRTPYGKESEKITGDAIAFQNLGFNFVSCDVRGRGDSDGNFIPYMNEAEDGVKLIEWCSKQPWSDGNIFTWGASYSARVQWLTALKKPQALKGMISIVSPSDPFVENSTCIQSPTYISWLFSISGHGMQNLKLVDFNSAYEKLPLIQLDEATGRNIPFWKEMIKHDTTDPFWNPLFYQKKLHTLDIPVMHISGWYDDEQIGTFINYEGMRRESKSAFSMEHQYIIVGPWAHDVNRSQILGRLDFGKESLLDLIDEECAWIKKILSRKEEKLHVKLFIMGMNKWFTFEEFPTENLKISDYFLVSEGDANGKSGNGFLSSSIPDYDQRSDEFSYDPMNPVPYLGTDSFSQMGGPDDYSKIEEREDILIYTTSPMESDLIILGKITSTLFIETDAADTDFTVKLVDVWPDGYCQRLVDGICRLSYRDGYKIKHEHSEGKKLEVNIDLWNTGHVVKPGHRIRIEVSSSAFPKYARNQNISGIQWNTDETRVARQKVYHGKATQSKISISTIDEKFLVEKEMKKESKI